MAWQAAAQMRPKPAMISEINGYTSWREVTRKPVEMEPRVAAMCAVQIFPSRSAAPPETRGSQGPHRKKYIRVFVNSIAEEQMFGQKQPRFPVGSVIVKQKLPVLEGKNRKSKNAKPQKISEKPELLTIMFKRERGYDAKNGDWEYIVTGGAGTQVSERGKIEACQNCHRPFDKTDYIVRSYLPKDVEKALKAADAALEPPEKSAK